MEESSLRNRIPFGYTLMGAVYLMVWIIELAATTPTVSYSTTGIILEALLAVTVLSYSAWAWQIHELEPEAIRKRHYFYQAKTGFQAVWWFLILALLHRVATPIAMQNSQMTGGDLVMVGWLIWTTWYPYRVLKGSIRFRKGKAPFYEFADRHPLLAEEH